MVMVAIDAPWRSRIVVSTSPPPGSPIVRGIATHIQIELRVRASPRPFRGWLCFRTQRMPAAACGRPVSVTEFDGDTTVSDTPSEARSRGGLVSFVPARRGVADDRRHESVTDDRVHGRVTGRRPRDITRRGRVADHILARCGEAKRQTGTRTGPCRASAAAPSATERLEVASVLARRAGSRVSAGSSGRPGRGAHVGSRLGYGRQRRRLAES